MVAENNDKDVFTLTENVVLDGRPEYPFSLNSVLDKLLKKENELGRHHMSRQFSPVS
jgi:hypothetical protein